MKASILILAGLGLCVGLSGCQGYSWDHDHDHTIDLRTDKERADACVASVEGGKSPQVMTYDSTTKTETHLNTQGRDVTVTAQNSTDDTSLGAAGRVGGRLPATCTDEVPQLDSGYDQAKEHHHKNKNANNDYH